MSEELEKALGKFIERFNYLPNNPERLDFDQNEMAELLYKCVEDDFDYTIEKYGTIPSTRNGTTTVYID